MRPRLAVPCVTAAWRAGRCVTTKLRASDAGREQETIRASLDAMGLVYLDLWLIHWPVARGGLV
jgi:diketogulonate reductase-like aldo/keto reductase